MPQTATSNRFIEKCRELRHDLANDQRILLAIAGPPAAGKSTLANRVVDAINTDSPGDAALVGMDGFHFDNQLLEQRGMLERKGAPFTFDVGGFAATLRRISSNEEPVVIVPRYDRSIGIARAGTIEVAQNVRVVVVEGNYLLIDEQPWLGLASLFTSTAFIEVDEHIIEQRILDRWEHYGLPPEVGRSKLDDNDLPNARYVAANSRRPDWLIVDGGVGVEQETQWHTD